MKALRKLTQQEAQRLAIASQLLDRSQRTTSKRDVLEVIRQLGCVQIDPIQVVIPSHYLVLWSRLGSYKTDWLDELLWQDKSLFEYWAHAASIVLAENYPIHRHQMVAFGDGNSAWSHRARRWLDENKAARRAILGELAGGQTLAVGDFSAEVEAIWESTGWTNAQGVKHLLQLMWRKGEVAVAGRQRNQKLYARADHWYQDLGDFEVVQLEPAMEQAVKIAFGALGVATARHVDNHFIKGFYHELESTIARLVDAGELMPVLVEGGDECERWYLPERKLPLLNAIQQDDWAGHTTLLSPFDNLTTDRDRVDRLWGFNARSELYVPKKDRVYGHYVLPILWRDRLAGRVDPTFIRQEEVLEIEAIFAEDWSRGEPAVASDLAVTLMDLADFLGASEIRLSRRIPRAWQKPLRAALG